MFSPPRRALFVAVVVAIRYYLVSVFKYDTVHGVYDGTVENDESNLIVDGKKIKVRYLCSWSSMTERRFGYFQNDAGSDGSLLAPMNAVSHR